jgi:hypothetical protein
MSQQQPTPEQALELLNTAAQQLQANRQTHVALQQAYEILKVIVKAQDAFKEPSK